MADDTQTTNTSDTTIETSLAAATEQMVKTATELQNAQITLVSVQNTVTTKASEIVAADAAAPVPEWTGTSLGWKRGSDDAVLAAPVELKGATGSAAIPVWNGTTLSFQNESGATIAQGVDLKGDKGDTGANGTSVTVQTSQTANGATVILTDATGPHTINLKEGVDGVDGVSPTISVDTISGGLNLTISDKDGVRTATINHGTNGTNGVTPTITTSAITGGTRITIDSNLENSTPQTVDVMHGTSPTCSVSVGANGEATITCQDANGTTTANIAQGAQGPKGDTGATGATGPAPTLTAGTVKTLAAGSDATFTLVNNGNDSYTINLGLPCGAKGDTGDAGQNGTNGTNGTNGIDGKNASIIVRNVTEGATPNVTADLVDSTTNTYAFDFTFRQIPDASTSAKGIVQLSDAIDSTSTTLAATANAVKQVYDLANSKTAGALATQTTAGLMSAQDKIKLDSMAAFVKTPTVSLDKNSINKDNNVKLTGSTFAYNGNSGTHAKTEWKVCVINDGNETVAWSQNVNSANTSTTVPANTFDPGEYYCFVRYYDSVTQSWSLWSDGTALKVVNSLDSTSWATIASYSQEGVGANYFDIGDTKTISLSGTVGTQSVSGSYRVTIIDFNYGDENNIIFQGFKTTAGANVALCDSKYGSTASDGTLCFNMNHWGNANYGGWKGCDLRYDVLGSTDKEPSGYGAAAATGRVGYDATSEAKTSPKNNTLMKALPSDLRNVLKPWTVYSDNVGGSSNVEANVTKSIDYLPLLSEFEVQGARSYANQYEKNSQSQMAYYANGNSKIKYKHSDGTTAVYWWLRSPYYNNATLFCCVTTDGSASSSNAYHSRGLAPAFKL